MKKVIDVGKTKTRENLEFCESEIAVKKETKNVEFDAAAEKFFCR